MTLLLLLWLAVLVLGVLCWQAAPHYPTRLLKPYLKNISLEETAPISTLEKLEKSKWFSPGWFIHKTTNQEKITTILTLVQSRLGVAHFLSLKQAIWLGFMLFFWCYLWFGEVSWENSFWLLFLFSLSLALPHLWLQIQKEKHLKQLNQEVPYFIDLLSLTLQTGLNIEQALRHVVTNKGGLVAKTIAKDLKEIELGRSLEEVLENLQAAIPNVEFQHFITSILRAKKLGVSLANTLEIQSQLIRTRRRQQAEEMSRTAAVKISLPLVLFIFPALLMIYIGPGLLNLMSQT